MNDLAPMGHNSAELVPYDPDAYATLQSRVAELADAGGAWLDLGTLDTEDQAQNVVDFRDQVKKHAKAIEDERKRAKQPHLDAGREIDGAFERLAAPVKKLNDAIGRLLTDYQTAKQRRLDDERRKREAAERARAEEARRAAEEAAKRNDVIGQAKAEEAAVEAQKAAEAAAKPERARVESATGGARTVSLRTTYEASYDADMPREVARVKVLNALCRSPAYAERIDEFLLSLADSAKRSVSGPDTIPGIHFTPVQKAV